jgi:hypothetical protein
MEEVCPFLASEMKTSSNLDPLPSISAWLERESFALARPASNDQLRDKEAAALGCSSGIVRCIVRSLLCPVASIPSRSELPRLYYAITPPARADGAFPSWRSWLFARRR